MSTIPIDNPPITTPGAVANFFLAKAEEKNNPLTQMQLQKLMYFAYGWCLASQNQPLFNAGFHAWDFGPVCVPIYNRFKQFGRGHITPGTRMEEITFEDNGDGSFSVNVGYNSLPNSESDLIKMLDFVWDAYSSRDGITLSNWTHIPDPDNPWFVAAQTDQLRKPMLDTAIRDYFNKLQSSERLY